MLKITSNISKSNYDFSYSKTSRNFRNFRNIIEKKKSPGSFVNSPPPIKFDQIFFKTIDYFFIKLAIVAKPLISAKIHMTLFEDFFLLVNNHQLFLPMIIFYWDNWEKEIFWLKLPLPHGFLIHQSIHNLTKFTCCIKVWNKHFSK